VYRPRFRTLHRNPRSPIVTVPSDSRRRFARFSVGVLAWNLVVILWGAFVRATGSGAGCGDHWPRCDGEVIPRLASTEQIIEFTHRATSGLALIAVVAMLVWAFRAFPKRHPVRLGAVLSTVLIITEALIGAGLVLLRYVALDQRVGRVYMMGAHLFNTFLLLGALTLTAWWAFGGRRIRVRGQGAAAVVLGVAIVATLLVGITGAVTALGDTLFPKTELSLAVASTAHFLERLRVVHPLLAIVTGIYITLAGLLVRRLRPGAATERLSRVLVALFFAQLVGGAINVVLLAPVWMQLVHLLMADAVWMALVLTAAAALADESSIEAVPSKAGSSEPRAASRAAPAVHPAS
jgi:heme A synthase